MKKRFKITFVGIVVIMLLVGFTGIALAGDVQTWENSPSKVTEDTTTLYWTGQGAPVDQWCGVNADFGAGGVVNGATEDSYMLWIFTTSGSVGNDPTLTINGTTYGNAFKPGNSGTYQFVTPYYAPEDILSAYTSFTVTDPGKKAWVLTISHGCDGAYEQLDVNKTVDTSYTRTHDWSVDKSVDPEDLYLYVPGQEGLPSSGSITWTVVVSYEGYTDSDWNVYGDITIDNTGTLDADIQSVSDLLAGDSIAVDCGVTFPYTLPVDESLTCSYSQDGYVEGNNVATVTTLVDTYSDTKPIVWGDPTTEVNATADVEDDLGGYLGTVTAPDGDSFSYTWDFDWADFGAEECGDQYYNNTAQVIGDEDVVLDEDTATATVHVQCIVYETAYALGDTPTCFIDLGFGNWGWTNEVFAYGTYTWPLWAGAGQCNTDNGTLVGTVTVTYTNPGYAYVTYDVELPYILSETHVYIGVLPTPPGTVAPGQYQFYTSNGPFGGYIYVIAHAVVGMPDPNFP
jgi:hypothetical protein